MRKMPLDAMETMTGVAQGQGTISLWQPIHSFTRSFLQRIFPESCHVPGTVLGAVDLRVNKAEGVPALLELMPLKGKAHRQANEVNKRISECDNETDMGQRRTWEGGV